MSATHQEGLWTGNEGAALEERGYPLSDRERIDLALEIVDGILHDDPQLEHYPRWTLLANEIIRQAPDIGSDASNLVATSVMEEIKAATNAPSL